MTLVRLALNLHEKIKVYPQVLTFILKPQIWLFHVVVLQVMAKKRAKVKSAHAWCAKLLFLPTKIICIFVMFSLPVWFLKLPIVSCKPPAGHCRVIEGTTVSILAFWPELALLLHCLLVLQWRHILIFI